VDLVPESEVAIKKSAGFIHQHLGLVKYGNSNKKEKEKGE
jgi:hypothetical protein